MLLLIFAKLLETQADAFKIISQAKRSENAIPDREQGGVVGIGFRDLVGVMDLVHGWRSKKEAEGPIDATRQADVGMVKLNDREKNQLIESEVPEFRAE